MPCRGSGNRGNKKLLPLYCRSGSGIDAGLSLSHYRSKEMETSTLDQTLIHAILREIDTCLHAGILPLHNDYLKHLSEKGEILEYLLFMRDERLIGGALVTRGLDNTPHRMTNISLTYLGIKALRLQMRLEAMRTPGSEIRPE